jgi:hypothetical protein
MGALGTTDVKTPHMDALAASAALFRRAYVAYPVCSASKACIMTGLHAHTNGLVNNTNNYLKPAAKLTEAEKNSPPYLHTRIRTAAPTMIEVLVQERLSHRGERQAARLAQRTLPLPRLHPEARRQTGAHRRHQTCSGQAVVLPS